MDKIAILERLLEITKEEKELIRKLIGVGDGLTKDSAAQGSMIEELKKIQEQIREKIKENGNQCEKNPLKPFYAPSEGILGLYRS